MLRELKAQLEEMYRKEKQLTEDLGVFNIALPPSDELRRLEAVRSACFFYLYFYKIDSKNQIFYLINQMRLPGRLKEPINHHWSIDVFAESQQLDVGVGVD